MFNGIFGHKPTGALLSVEGHFPYSKDEYFRNYLVVGPMCRYAKDLPTLMHIMAGPNADKLRLNEPLYTKDIKVSWNQNLNSTSTPIYWYFLHSYCILDFLQRRLRILVGWYSSSAWNENRDASSRQTFPIERPGNEGSWSWFIPENDRMRTGPIFPNGRHPIDRSRRQRDPETRQHLLRNGQKYVRQIKVQLRRFVFLLFVCNKWIDSETKNTQILANGTTGATTTTGKLENKESKTKIERNAQWRTSKSIVY